MASKRKPELFSATPLLKKRKTTDSNKSAKKQTGKKEIPDVAKLDFSNESVNGEGKKWNFKISSWNVNGVRAWCEKKGHTYLDHEDADVVCMQETKCQQDKIPPLAKPKGYSNYWSSAEKSGYSGTGLLSKVKPIKVTYGIDHSEHDTEGRVITAEFEKFFFVTVYVPNSGAVLARLPYRTQEWDVAFHQYLVDLEEKKSVILSGDLNVAFLDIDLANPKSNQKTAGFTKEERQSFGKLLNTSFVDSFRHLYPSLEKAYTYWSYMGNARARNIGWRLDYFMISKSLLPNLCDVVIRKDVYGSDHCPLVLFLNL